MLAEQRRSQITDILHRVEKDVVSVNDLSGLLGVSTMTVRRDLDALEGIGLVKRVHGGARAFQKSEEEGEPFFVRHEQFSQEKQAIGQAAARLVNNGETILLDAGTTTLQVARALGGIKNLVAVTHALPVAQVLAQFPQVSTIVIGGILKRRERCAVGPMVTQELARFSIDKLFLSAAGFDIRKGATDPDIMEVDVKQSMIKVAREIILVADSSKCGVVAMSQIASWKSIHKLVTDDRLPAEMIEAIEGSGVEVITPGRLTFAQPEQRSI